MFITVLPVLMTGKYDYKLIFVAVSRLHLNLMPQIPELLLLVLI